MKLVYSIGFITISTVLALPQPEPPAKDAQAVLAEARSMWQTGKYAEAQEAFENLAKTPAGQDPKIAGPLAKHLADALLSQGEIEKAREALDQAIAQQPANPDLLAKLAELKFNRGDWDGADQAIAAALKANPNHLPARFAQAKLAEARGQSSPKSEEWKWFVDQYNERRTQFLKEPENLLLVGQAAERYYKAQARGEELSESLNDVINDIYEGALRADPNCWQAALLEGRLFLSGYNERAAMPELQRALKINPLATEVLVTLGQADLQGYKLANGRKRATTALEINPHYAPAFVLLADLNISDERFADALDAAEKATKENPRDEDSLARLAAANRLLLKPLEADAIELAVRTRNPKPATFYSALGERLADRRKYTTAERAFLKSIEADPERADSRIGLGMLYMQVGREPEARDLFAKAFQADPFNVRANNMIEVLKHLAGYTTVETDHYKVLVDPAQDSLTGKYMALYLEKVHKELTDRFGYQLPAKTQIEILKSHRWFSARTIGLPFIPTVGACTGKVVALASPRATGKPFHWARVLKHEVVHVITLQQTEFNIPHWYTEALAVESEGFPRPQEWNKLLLERVPDRKNLLNLDTINLGFIRPKEPEDRSMAYCQSQLYAQYMLKRFGPDALIKMLYAYRQGLTTEAAIKTSFNVEKKDFEARYLEFLDGVVRTIKARVSSEKPVPFSQLEQMIAEKPEDAELNAKMAYEHFSRRDYKAARPFADKALKLQPRQPLASYVKARLLTLIGDEDAALELLKPALDPAAPNERVVDLLAELTMKAGNLEDAEKLYELARQGDPALSKWIAGLTRVHLRQKRMDKVLDDLGLLAANDADDLVVRKELAQRHYEAKQYADAETWAMECLYVDVADPDAHLILADASSALKKYSTAIEEYETCLGFKPKKPNDIKVKLARAQREGGQPAKAKATLESVLKADPAHPDAVKLKEEWDSAAKP